MSLFLLLLMLATCDSQYNLLTVPFKGAVMTYYPKNTTTTDFMVNVRYTVYYELCTNLGWQCLSGDCGGENTVVYTVKSSDIEGWCQTEGVSTRQIPSNAPFQLWFNGSDWTSNANGIVRSKAVTLVELRTRSDTGKANTSPQTTILADLRVPSNCERVYSLLAFDPDGDDVKCRPGNASLSECDTCTLPLGLVLDNCTFSLMNSSVLEGSLKYVIQLVMEDFPRQTITLTQSDGSRATLTTSDAISKIPVQFLLQLDPPAPSCTEGLYIPQFLPPTPTHGALFITRYLQIDITVQANLSTISDLVVSGPHNVIVTLSGPGQFTLSWSPIQDEDGESHSICFVAEATLNSVVYQSVLRCVIAIVDLTPAAPSIPVSPLYVVNNTEPATTLPDTVNTSNITDSPSPLVVGTTPSPNPASASTPAPMNIVGLSVKVSSLTPLSDADIFLQVKNILVSFGLPQDVVVRIVNAVQL
ncbi:uncharacterized protein LOC114850675 [Betta splendens]|uniref:Uncharacterized protein LOC114850675 n=1 Tax=Betta splendens TaxID=158456 RepID=A0A6P7LW63_BETSP|nr:uncharacterized protein LOC114850675 [Betta splendens]